MASVRVEDMCSLTGADRARSEERSAETTCQGPEEARQYLCGESACTIRHHCLSVSDTVTSAT